jgi:hypothetical protein
VHFFLHCIIFKYAIQGVDIKIGPNTSIYLQGLLANFYNLSLHIQDKNLKKIREDENIFNLNVIYKTRPRLIVDLSFCFIFDYDCQHKANNVSLNNLSMVVDMVGNSLALKCIFIYGFFDHCPSVNILDIMDYVTQHVKIC